MFGFTKLSVWILIALVPAGAAAPEWTVDLKSLGMPTPPRRMPEFADRALVVGFSVSNEVLLSFILHGTQEELETRQSSAGRARLVALILDHAYGTVTRRQQWEAETPPTPRIARLAEGGFVLLRGDQVQILDDSLHSIRERRLALPWSDKESNCGYWCMPSYTVKVPAKGRLFAVVYFRPRPGSLTAPDSYSTQVIDSQSLGIVDEWDGEPLAELYEDSILAANREAPKIKRIREPWHPFGVGLALRPWLPHFLTADRFTAHNGRCWFETDGTAVLGKPVCYSEPNAPGARLSSQDGSVIAVGVGGPASGFAALLDLNGESRVIVYTQGTHRKLLTVPPSREGEEGVALSLDGSLLAIVRGEKLSLFKVPRR